MFVFQWQSCRRPRSVQKATERRATLQPFDAPLWCVAEANREPSHGCLCAAPPLCALLSLGRFHSWCVHLRYAISNEMRWTQGGNEPHDHYHGSDPRKTHPWLHKKELHKRRASMMLLGVGIWLGFHEFVTLLVAWMWDESAATGSLNWARPCVFMFCLEFLMPATAKPELKDEASGSFTSRLQNQWSEQFNISVELLL